MSRMRRLAIDGRDIGGIVELFPEQFGDERGFFSEVYSQRDLSRLGIDVAFVQENHSLSTARGTVRGLHFQAPPFAQVKLIRVVRGAIFDVAVDLRTGSPTYGRHVSAIISAQRWNQLFVPAGFAHGFCTLEPETEVLYKVDTPYSPDHDRGLLWCDPELGIDWPVDPRVAVISSKDKSHPRLSELKPYFHFAGAGRGEHVARPEAAGSVR